MLRFSLVVEKVWTCAEEGSWIYKDVKDGAARLGEKRKTTEETEGEIQTQNPLFSLKNRKT